MGIHSEDEFEMMREILGGQSPPDDVHHFVGGKDFCDSAIANMKALGIDIECRHKDSATAANIKAQFELDAAEWQDESEYMSTVIDMVTLPSYQRIIGLGPAAVPLIIDRLREDPDHWFVALVAIVGEDKAAGATTLKEATRRWIEWYDENNSNTSA